MANIWSIQIVDDWEHLGEIDTFQEGRPVIWETWLQGCQLSKINTKTIEFGPLWTGSEPCRSVIDWRSFKYCFIQLHTQFCSLGINFNVCFVFYVDGGESGKIFPTFSSTRFSEQFPALNIQILLVAPNCVLSTGFREQPNTWCRVQMGDFWHYSVKTSCQCKENCDLSQFLRYNELKAPFAQSMPRNWQD